MSWIAAGVSALGDLLGGGLNAIYNARAAKKNYEYNQRLQDDAQAHQIYMYQNQNQWRVNDLRAAGLNPILATHAGSSMPSASAGHSAMASPANFDFSNTAKSIGRALYQKSKKESDLLDAQIKETEARTGEIKGRSKVSNAFGDIAKEGSSLFSSAKNVSNKFASFIGSNLGDLFFNRKNYTLPTAGFSAADEKRLDELIKEDDARRGKNWQRVGNRIIIYKKAK